MKNSGTCADFHVDLTKEVLNLKENQYFLLKDEIKIDTKNEFFMVGWTI